MEPNEVNEHEGMVEVIATKDGFDSAKGAFVEKGEKFFVPAERADKGSWWKRVEAVADELLEGLEAGAKKVEKKVVDTLSGMNEEMKKNTKGQGWKA